ncbi:MAG TPA: SOS response-associated peptidase [Thermoleophilaceae bacterium]|nr:SOS response-associated peptidase [Thermoleophilaceae bacterium]
MCGRYTNTASAGDVATKLKEALQVSLETDDGCERFNVSPSQKVLTVVEDKHGRRAELLRWGLVPSWAKDVKVGFKMINARAETVGEKPAYRSLVGKSKHRCLIVADGFYEWMKPEDRKQPRQPMHFSLAGGEPFCFAGLWTRWQDPETEEWLPSCTILTTEPNELVKPIHNRMPVILVDPGAMEAWLDPELAPADLKAMLAPLDPERMVVRAANPIVNSAKHEGPDCLAPAT